MLNYQRDILKNVHIFDYFNNEKKKEVKIGFRFTFQSKEVTLNSSDIDSVIDDIVSKSLKIGGISIPGI